MHFQNAQIGQQVVRSKGDYVIGRIGEIIERDELKNRVKVAWAGNTKTWVFVDSIQPTYIPYDIIHYERIDKKAGIKVTVAKYVTKQKI